MIAAIRSIDRAVLIGAGFIVVILAIGSTINNTDPRTDVNHSPRSGLRQRVARCSPGGGCWSKPRHSRVGNPYPP